MYLFVVYLPHKQYAESEWITTKACRTMLWPCHSYVYLYTFAWVRGVYMFIVRGFPFFPDFSVQQHLNALLLHLLKQIFIVVQRKWHKNIKLSCWQISLYKTSKVYGGWKMSTSYVHCKYARIKWHIIFCLCQCRDIYFYLNWQHILAIWKTSLQEKTF